MADHRVPNQQDSLIDTQDIVDTQASDSPTIYDSCQDIPQAQPWARVNFVPSNSSMYIGEFVNNYNNH